MKQKKFILCTFFILFTFLTVPAAAYAGESHEEDEDRPLAPYMIILNQENASLEHFPLKETTVSTNIDGIIAATTVTQTYANEGKTPINASYVFPAPTGVTVHGMQMIIGNHIITAQIKEKEEAKTEYEEAKSEGKSASLLEQQRPNVFTMDVANIMPGDNVRIELFYTELITPSEGSYQFVFPTVVGPRYAGLSEDTDENGWVETPCLPENTSSPGKYDINVTLSAGVPIADISCSSHKIKVVKDTDSFARIGLAPDDAGDFAGNRDFILDYKLNGEEVNCGLMLNTGEDENYFMLMVQPPERQKPEEILPREYIFVLDVSGSMDGYPLNTAKGLIKNLVSNLRSSDCFNLVLFSNDAILMSSRSLKATDKNIREALDFIEDKEGGGGTELAPAIEAALSVPANGDMVRSIVVITDGYVAGEKEIFKLIDNNLGSVSFFPFGIGSSVNRYLIDGIAKSGLGEAFLVTDSSEAASTAETFRTYIESPVLSDIQVVYDGFDVYDVEPRSLPTLFAQKPIVVYGKWRGEAAGEIKITGKTGSRQAYSQTLSVSETPTPENNDAIRYLWARKRIERLTDYGINENNPDIKEEVTEIGLKYSMMTPYTSFIAVMETVRNPSGSSTDIDQPLPLPLEVSNLALGGYRIGSEPGEVLLAVISLMILAGGYVKRRRKSLRKG